MITEKEAIDIISLITFSTSLNKIRIDQTQSIKNIKEAGYIKLSAVETAKK